MFYCLLKRNKLKNINMEVNVSGNYSTEDMKQDIRTIAVTDIMYKIGKIYIKFDSIIHLLSHQHLNEKCLARG